MDRYWTNFIGSYPHNLPPLVLVSLGWGLAFAFEAQFVVGTWTHLRDLKDDQDSDKKAAKYDSIEFQKRKLLITIIFEELFSRFDIF